MKSLITLRVVAGVHAVAICLQPLFAGIYLNGSTEGIRLHEPLGLTLPLIGFIQLLVATIWWRSGGPAVAALVSLLIVVGEGVQITMGFTRQLAIHIPLGIALVGTTVAFALWVNRQRAVVPA